jgi:hypothetical protein
MNFSMIIEANYQLLSLSILYYGSCCLLSFASDWFTSFFVVRGFFNRSEELIMLLVSSDSKKKSVLHLVVLP